MLWNAQKNCYSSLLLACCRLHLVVASRALPASSREDALCSSCLALAANHSLLPLCFSLVYFLKYIICLKLGKVKSRIRIFVRRKWTNQMVPFSQSDWRHFMNQSDCTVNMTSCQTNFSLVDGSLLKSNPRFVQRFQKRSSGTPAHASWREQSILMVLSWGLCYWIKTSKSLWQETIDDKIQEVTSPPYMNTPNYILLRHWYTKSLGSFY